MSNYRDKWFENNDSNHGWYECKKCGKKLRKGDVDIDHIIPQKYVKNDSLVNLQCLCKSCNRSKKADLSDTPKDLLKNSVEVGKKKIKNLFK